MAQLTTGISTRNVTEDPPPVTVSIRFPVAPAPVPVGLASALVPLRPPDVAAAPAPLVATDTSDVAAEPQTPERPQPPTQDVLFTDDNSFHNNELSKFIRSTSTCDNSNVSLHDKD